MAYEGDHAGRAGSGDGAARGVFERCERGIGAGTGSTKPVAALLAAVKPPIGADNRAASDNVPKARPEWIAALTKTDSAGKPLTTAQAISLNLAALVDEAAKTEDLDSLVKLCYLDCDDLPTLMPAKDASGRTGFQRLSQLLEKTHPAPGQTQGPSLDYPGFAVPEHGTVTAADKLDMKLLGGLPYKGLKTGFLLDDGASAHVGWDAVLGAAQ